MKTDYFRMTDSGYERMQEAPERPLYSRYYAFGGGNSESLWAVIEGSKLVKMPPHWEDDYFSTPYRTIDKYDNGLSKRFGIGFYYDDINPDFRFSREQVENAIKEADLFLEKRHEQETKQARKDAKELEMLPSMFPHLEVVGKKKPEATLKRNILAHLRHKFPGIRFTARKGHSYSSFDVTCYDKSIDLERLRQETSIFEAHSFDESGDFYDYTPKNFNRVFGGAKYLFFYYPR